MAHENQYRQVERHMQKTTKSNVEFKNTKVTTGEKIFVRNGQAVAIGFKQNPAIRAHTDKQKMMDQASFSQ